MPEIVPWVFDFPPAAYFVPTAELTAHPSFKPAKRGNLDAARRVVADLANWDPLDHLTSDTRPHAFAAVLSPGEGENQLPGALAEAVEQRYEIPVLPIRKQRMGRRTKTSARDRFLHRPQFESFGEAPDLPRLARVIMLDDVITTGGSLAELRLFLWSRNFWPVGAAVIAATPSYIHQDDGSRLSPQQSTLRRLLAKHPDVAAFLRTHAIYDGEIGCLTEAEARTLLSLPSLQETPAPSA